MKTFERVMKNVVLGSAVAAAMGGSGNASVCTDACKEEKGGKPMACEMGAMTSAQQARHQQLVKQLRTHLEVTELPDGWGYRYPLEPGIIKDLAEFTTLEHLCCPFIVFSLVVDGERDEVWLKWTGRKGVKEMVAPSQPEKSGKK